MSTCAGVYPVSQVPARDACTGRAGLFAFRAVGCNCAGLGAEGSHPELAGLLQGPFAGFVFAGADPAGEDQGDDA